jgi:malonyl CoA-acyl carrier protein transacylase
MQWLLEQGVECFIECGPGQALTGLIKRIAPPSVIANSYLITSLGYSFIGMLEIK